jgi:hypothetical protein
VQFLSRHNLWLKFDCIALKFDISATHSYSAGDESGQEITNSVGLNFQVVNLGFRHSPLGYVYIERGHLHKKANVS